MHMQSVKLDPTNSTHTNHSKQIKHKSAETIKLTEQKQQGESGEMVGKVLVPHMRTEFASPILTQRPCLVAHACTPGMTGLWRQEDPLASGQPC